ncbi:integral membrane protein [Aspergillus arachidicola]|uniref:Integral membrane protein n=1 Tax=Aspergillus arachidicola TaxID=656916 RepID=A0A2G7FYG2_9EURO|nr:integral membrane protein [Aspergillus arachidicola]
MNLPQVVPFALLSTTFVFAVVELGLTGHLVSYFSQGSKEYRYDPSRNGYTSQTVTVAVPPILAFILFNSVWTMLVSVATAIIPWVFRSKADTNAAFNKLITIGLLGLYFVTTVFWLASFADMAARLSYAAGKSDYVNAIIAFAVLTWFLFCALTLAVVLGICGVLKSDLPGYKPLGKQDPPATAPQSTQMDQV